MNNWDWSEFDPKQGQQDKRAREGCLTKAWTFVKNNFNQLGISSFVAVPLVDNNRCTKKIVHCYPPNNLLESSDGCTTEIFTLWLSNTST